MRPWERWLFNGFALLVAVSGAAYGWMKYFVQPEDPFAVVNHPWQPAMLHLHVLASPPFVLLFGILLNSHILKKLQATRVPNRTTGMLSLATFATMIASGYLLQVVTAESGLRLLVLLHVGSGAIFSLAYLTHLIYSVRLARRAARARIPEVA